MSGWVKMGVDLRTHPKVVRMASALKADKLRVIGGLWAVWCIFDAHTDDGHLDGYTLAAVDEDLGWKGFAAAMASIGWLEETVEGLTAPDYEEHNGPTAKRRATETSRKGKARKVSAGSPRVDGNESGQMSASHADNSQTKCGTDKRREEESNTPPTPKGVADPPGFSEFWSAWPSSDRKVDRKKCAAKWRRCAFGDQLPAILANIEVLRQSRQWREGFEPAPLTYLNGERWNDEAAAERTPDWLAETH